MKNLLFVTLFCFTCLSSYSQLNCNNVKASSHTMAGLYPDIKQILFLNTTPLISGSRISQTYIIDWGDNSTSTLTQWFNSVGHSYLNLGTYPIKMKLIVYDSVFNITCVDSTYDTAVVTGPYCDRLHASIAVSVSNGTATLVNKCNPDEPGFSSASYYYKWGDNGSGTTSLKNNLTHNYTTSGTYKVSMVFTLGNAYKVCRDTTDTTITVVVPPVNEISGYVYTDSPLTGPNDTIKLWLIKYDATGKKFKPVDSLLMAPIRYYLGYKFKNPSPGSYLLKAAIIGQPSFTGNVPTYHDSGLVWNKAHIIPHTGGVTNATNVLMRTGKVTSGPGAISGKVQNSYTSQGIGGMNVLLLDGSGLPLAYGITDNNGDYSFSNLPYGTYVVYPEDLSYMTTPATININGTNTTFTALTFERIEGNNTIVLLGTGIREMNNSTPQFVANPNPAKNIVNINWTKASGDIANIIITDVSGKRVVNTTAQMNGTTTVRLDNLQPGLYFMSVTTENDRATLKLIIQ